MMTQQLHKHQGFDRYSCKFLEDRSNQNLNALSLEIKHSQDYQKAKYEYIEYEINSVEEEFGELFRVWQGRTLLGTLYKNSEGWRATPFYLCKQYIKTDRS